MTTTITNATTTVKGPIAKHLAERLSYPATEQLSHTENRHGKEISDPYFWLEGNDENVKAWDAQQNFLARQFLDSTSNRESIKQRLNQWFELGNIDCPFVIKGKQFQWR